MNHINPTSVAINLIYTNLALIKKGNTKDELLAILKTIKDQLDLIKDYREFKNYAPMRFMFDNIADYEKCIGDSASESFKLGFDSARMLLINNCDVSMASNADLNTGKHRKLAA